MSTTTKFSKPIDDEIGTLNSKIITVSTEVTFSAGEARKSAIKTVQNAGEYNWVASQFADSTNNYYSNVFVEGIIANANTLSIACNRTLRNDTSGSITVKICAIGILR